MTPRYNMQILRNDLVQTLEVLDKEVWSGFLSKDVSPSWAYILTGTSINLFLESGVLLAWI